MTAPTIKSFDREGKARVGMIVPQDFNGYATVARETIRVPAEQVKVGDIIIDSVFINEVAEVRDLGPVPGHGGRCIFLAGTYNRFRASHEIVTVIRP